MDTGMKVAIVALATIAFIAVTGFILINSTLQAYAPIPKLSQAKATGFATCLSQKGIKMAGAEWCSACKSQKRLFGKAFEFVNFVDCEKEKAFCEENNIKYYPTWILSSGKKVVGVQSIQKLAELSGCKA